jgi:hypothetical protein
MLQYILTKAADFPFLMQITVLGVYCFGTFRDGPFSDLGSLVMGCYVMGRFVLWDDW